MGNMLKTDISILQTIGSYMDSTFIRSLINCRATSPDSGLLNCDPNPGDNCVQGLDSREAEGLLSLAPAITTESKLYAVVMDI